MEVIYDENTLREYVEKAVGVTPDRPLLIDRFLKNALECEADALADCRPIISSGLQNGDVKALSGAEGDRALTTTYSTHVYIPAVMEHVELAGIHSGDSACVIPPVSIPQDNLGTIKEYTKKIAENLHVCGLMNMQYAIEDGKVYVIEANVVRYRVLTEFALQTRRCIVQVFATQKLGKQNEVLRPTRKWPVLQQE